MQKNQTIPTVTTSKYSGKCDWEMPHSVFLDVVVLFSSGCRCGVGFVFLFVVSCFHFSVPISGWFFIVFFYTWISINLDAKIHGNFAKI